MRWVSHTCLVPCACNFREHCVGQNGSPRLDPKSLHGISDLSGVRVLTAVSCSTL